jgi:elongation factor Ts
MAEFTAKDVQSLRQATGAGMMDCKRALQESGGDVEAAKQWLREQGLAGAAKRSDREATQGAVAVATTADGAAIVELRCETDFVAKADAFVALTEELAGLVATGGEAAADAKSSAIDDLKTTLKENISIGRVVHFAITAGDVVGTYQHVQAGRGVNAVLVVMRDATEELAHDVAVHVAFARPAYVRRDEVPEADIAAERETVEKISRNEGKPEAALPKIVDGRMNGWFKERVLLEQSYAKDEKRSISDLIGSATIERFAQVEIGD